MTKLTFNGYVLADDDCSLIVQGKKDNRRIATVVEMSEHHLPLLFSKKGYAQTLLDRIKKLPLTPSAKTYCMSYRLRYSDPRELLKPRKCTITLDIE